MVRFPSRLLALGLLAAAPVSAQTPLTIDEAMARARAATPAARALAARTEEAAAQVREARAGYLPRVDVAGSVQRSNQPVFVFSSLLAQRRFSEADFDVASLNHPDPVTNVRTAVSIEQPVFDGGRTRLAVDAAEAGRTLAALEQVRSGQELALEAARVFVRVLQREADARAAAAAVESAESDLDRVRARRDAGTVTDADVLSVEVQLADRRQRQVSADGDLAVARIELAEAVGLPLDRPIAVVRPAPREAASDVEALVRDALQNRPDYRAAERQIALSETTRRAAQAAVMPRVDVQGGWEFNGSTWTAQRSNWLVGAQVQLNVFNGFADQARLAAARSAETRTRAEQEQLARRIEVEVRAAAARLAAARAREAAGRAAVAQARESRRIVGDRYDTGLATVADVLRAADAVLDAESRATSAEMDVILQSVALDRAAGRL